MAIHTIANNTSDGDFLGQHEVYPDVCSSIKHWQLRDLVCPGDNEDEVLSVSGTSAVRWSLKGNKKLSVDDLEFSPNSICYNPQTGYLAVGGQGAELEVMCTRTGNNSSGETLFRGSTEGSVHNALHMGTSSSGDPLLFASNNDSTVKVFKLPSMARASVVRCQLPINYSSLSPCGQMLCCVGDSTTATIYQERETGYVRLTSFSEAEDAGMCCSFSPGLGCLASAFQDGSVVVWDWRSCKTVHKYNLGASCRSCKFGQGPLDLLAFTEHDDYAWLVDTRKWSSMQRLDVRSAIVAAADAQSRTLTSSLSGGGAAPAGRAPPNLADEDQDMGSEPPTRNWWAAPTLADEDQAMGFIPPTRNGGAAPTLADEDQAMGFIPPSRNAPFRAGLSIQQLVSPRMRVGRFPLLFHPISTGNGAARERRVAVDISGIAFGTSARRLLVGTVEGLVSFQLNSAARRSFASGQLA